MILFSIAVGIKIGEHIVFTGRKPEVECVFEIPIQNNSQIDAMGCQKKICGKIKEKKQTMFFL